MNQTDPIGIEAQIANPALQPLSFLIGTWQTSGQHPMVPGVELIGRAAFTWHEGGAFLIMHTDMEDPRFPSGVAIIGSDDVAATFSMIYFDQRKISRMMNVEPGNGTVTWRRNTPELSQSMTITADGADRLIGIGRMSQDGGPWGDDLYQVFVRIG
jgi:hypothetical protein